MHIEYTITVLVEYTWLFVHWCMTVLKCRVLKDKNDFRHASDAAGRQVGGELWTAAAIQ